MNKTKIEYCDYTWNPIVGCRHGCWYCYAKRIYERFNPGNKYEDWQFLPNRLGEPEELKKPSTILVCSMADLFGEWVDEDDIQWVLDAIRSCPRHTFLLLTKNPARLPQFSPYPDNCWVGASVDYARRLEPSLHALVQVEAKVRWISFEPLLEDIELGDRSIGGTLDWIVIGALTGPAAKTHRPSSHWVLGLLLRAYLAQVPLFLKDNLIPVLGEDMVMRHRELPEGAAA